MCSVDFRLLVALNSRRVFVGFVQCVKPRVNYTCTLHELYISELLKFFIEEKKLSI
jgi:hypothetical protein